MALELAYSVQTVGKMTAEVSRGSPAERRHGQRKIILIGFHKHHLAVAELEGEQRCSLGTLMSWRMLDMGPQSTGRAQHP